MAELTLDIISRAMFSSDSELIKDTLYRSSVRYQAEMTLSPLALIPGANRVWALYKDMACGEDAQGPQRVDGANHRRAQEASQRGSHVDLLDRLLDARDPETGRGLSAKDVRDQMVTVFVAGHETTALALCWTWFLLSQHRGGRAGGLGGSRRWVEWRGAHLRRRSPPPLHAHGLRRGAAGSSPRFTRSLGARRWSGTRSAGAQIPAGAIIGIIPWVIHRHCALWEAPERFEPKRFSAERSSQQPRGSYIPFSYGPRFCIGASLALTEGVMVLAHVAQHYRLRLAHSQSVEPRGLLSLRPRNGLLMHRIRRAG